MTPEADEIHAMLRNAGDTLTHTILRAVARNEVVVVVDTASAFMPPMLRGLPVVPGGPMVTSMSAKRLTRYLAAIGLHVGHALDAAPPTPGAVHGVIVLRSAIKLLYLGPVTFLSAEDSAAVPPGSNTILADTTPDAAIADRN